ncbi:MAG: dihydrolipoyllysine-residue succinyltransferase, partial [bacterium]
ADRGAGAAAPGASAGGGKPGASAGAAATTGDRPQRRVKMSTLRKRVAENLVASKQHSAHLTTFNEVDMSAVKELRGKYRDAFEKKYGARLGFLSFFVKAAVAALQEFPEVNAFIDGEEIVYNDYYNIGVAVSTERGLIVPVLRNADRKSFGEIEREIISFGKRAQEKKLSPDELTGGTFTISNGGVFGSLLSTPIPNPPQTGVLGMHSIDDRAVVVDGEIVVRPMMYVALTYDHRIIDGREAVRFLVKIKEQIQDPAQMLLDL